MRLLLGLQTSCRLGLGLGFGCLSMNSIFTEVPVKLQVSCNLEPCGLNKLITITAAHLYEEAIPRTGKQEIYLEWP